MSEQKECPDCGKFTAMESIHTCSPLSVLSRRGAAEITCDCGDHFSEGSRCPVCVAELESTVERLDAALRRSKEDRIIPPRWRVHRVQPWTPERPGFRVGFYVLCLLVILALILSKCARWV